MRRRSGGLRRGIREKIGLTRIKGVELRRKGSSVRQSRFVGTSRLGLPNPRWQGVPYSGEGPRSRSGILGF